MELDAVAAESALQHSFGAPRISTRSANLTIATMQLPRLKQSSTMPVVKASRYWLSLIIAKSEMFAPQSQPLSRAAFL
jgi:hypothetical protein